MCSAHVIAQFDIPTRFPISILAFFNTCIDVIPPAAGLQALHEFIRTLFPIFIIPLFYWVKHIYIIEHTQENNLSYFSRYEVENPILHNIKCGIGVEKSFEVNKHNGIPAFISLFIPKTGLRNWPVSIAMFLICIIGFIKQLKIQNIFIIIKCKQNISLPMTVIYGLPNYSQSYFLREGLF